MPPGLENLLQHDRSWLRGVLVAGVSVAAVALPIGVAHAEIVCIPTEVGIYSAIFPLFAYALFGSSRHLMVGPDAATSILVAAALVPLAGGDPQRYLALKQHDGKTLLHSQVILRGCCRDPQKNDEPTHG